MSCERVGKGTSWRTKTRAHVTAMRVRRERLVFKSKHLHVGTFLVFALEHLPEGIEELLIGQFVIFVKIRERAKTG